VLKCSRIGTVRNDDARDQDRPEISAIRRALAHAGDVGESQLIREGDALPLIVQTDTIGTNHRYEAPGTVRVTMSFPG